MRQHGERTEEQVLLQVQRYAIFAWKARTLTRRVCTKNGKSEAVTGSETDRLLREDGTGRGGELLTLRIDR
jgi:hypothetical protein